MNDHRRHRTAFRAACLGLAVLAFPSGAASLAQSQLRAPQNNSDAAGTKTSQPPKTSAGIPEAELIRIGSEFGAALQSGNVERAAQFMHRDYLIRKAFRGLNVSDRDRRSFMAGLEEQLGPVEALQISKIIKNYKDRTAKYVRLFPGRRTPLPVVRIYSDGSFDFFALQVVAIAPGELRIADIYTFSIGQWQSDLLRDILLPYAAPMDPGFQDRATPLELALVENSDEIRQMSVFARERQLDRAIAAMEKLPRAVQLHKPMLIIRLGLMRERPEEYRAAVEQFREAFPNDAALDFIELRTFIAEEDWDAFLSALDKVEKVIGRDPYFDIQRGYAFINKGDPEKAAAHAAKAYNAESDLQDAYWLLVDASMAAQRFDVVARTLNFLISKFDVELADLSTVDEFQDFVNSPEYDAWLESRPDR